MRKDLAIMHLTTPNIKRNVETWQTQSKTVKT
jgi:hypothetical protein